jgi:hypothetical protein
MSVNGPKLVLSPDYAEEIKNDERFSLEEAGLRVSWQRSLDGATCNECALMVISKNRTTHAVLTAWSLSAGEIYGS